MAAAVEAQPQSEVLAKLSESELDQTVEQFLRAQCQQRVAALKRHIDGLISNFEGSAKSARQKLQDVAQQQQGGDEESAAESAADEEGGSAEASTSEPAPVADASCDPFALVCISGCHFGRIVRIEPTDDKRTWTIGRVEECDISLLGDDEVSSSHAKITFEVKRQQFKLVDTGSTNGTFVGGDGKKSRKLKARTNHVLKVGHLITFGGCTYQWTYDADAKALAERYQQIAGSGDE